MREYIYTNLKVIKKHIKIRSKKLSYKNKISLMQEYKEWDDNEFSKDQSIWTLPDLTRTERFKNFCRSIKKKIR